MKLKTLVFYQDLIKRAVSILSKIFTERSTIMGKGGGGSGGGTGGGGGRGGGGAGIAAGAGRGSGFGGGIRGPEGSPGISSTGAARVSGLRRTDSTSFPAALAVAGLGRIGEFSPLGPVQLPPNEGPLRRAALNLTVPFGRNDLNVPDPGGVAKPLDRPFLEKSLPFQDKAMAPLGRIGFRSPLSATKAVAEAEAIMAQVQRPLSKKAILAEANHWLGIKEPAAFHPRIKKTELIAPVLPQKKKEPAQILQFKAPQVRVRPEILPPHPAALVQPKVVARGLEQPKIEPAPAPAVQPATKTETRPDPKPVVLTQPAPEEQVTQEIVTERVINEQIDIVKEKRMAKQKKFTLDRPTLVQRLKKVISAARRAKSEAEKLGLGRRILGWLVNKYLNLSQPAYFSRVVPEGPDGTIPIIHKLIKGTGEFSTEEAVQTIVFNNRPVSEEEDGEPVSEEEVRKVFEDRLVKPRLVPAWTGNPSVAKRENTLRDFNLDQILAPKAA